MNLECKIGYWDIKSCECNKNVSATERPETALTC